MRKFILAFALLAIAGTANATLLTVGLVESGVGSFNRLNVFVNLPNPATFQGQGLSTFTNGGWVDTNQNSVWSRATGPTVTSLGFNLNLSYPPTTSVLIDLFADLNGTVVDGAQFLWNGTTFSYVKSLGVTIYNLDVTNASATPEPSTFILWSMGLGLIGIGMAHKKRREVVAT